MAEEATLAESNVGRQRGGRAYWDMQRRCTIIAGSVNVLMLIVFSYIGLQSLALVSVASIAAYALAYLCLQRRRNVLAMALIWSEVIVHASFGFLVQDGAPLSVTLTLGIMQRTDQEPLQETIRKADDRLYEGKRLGRNRVNAR